MKKIKLQLIFSLLLVLMYCWACKKETSPDDAPISSPGKIAYDWFNFQTNISKKTAGLGPGVSGIFFAYSGIALYESVVPGMPAYQSIYTYLTGQKIGAVNSSPAFYWPACANAALARFCSKFLAHTGTANLTAIDSMQAVQYASFQLQTDAETLSASINYGQQVGDAIYEWCITDGSATTPPAYSVPTGPGMWVPTPPANLAPTATNWGGYRSFVKNAADLTQPPAPIPYATDITSDFYKEAAEVYDLSLKLTRDDTLKARHWSNISGNYNGQAHLTNVLTQILQEKNTDLQNASLAYARHGMAIADAAISSFKTIYTYTRIRPVTYIRTVMGKSNWNSLIPATPHPEYSAVLTCITGASGRVLENITGTNYSFTDNTHASIHGSFKHNTISAYVNSVVESQLLAGVHFSHSLIAGLDQGKKVGQLVLELPFKK